MLSDNIATISDEVEEMEKFIKLQEPIVEAAEKVAELKLQDKFEFGTLEYAVFQGLADAIKYYTSYEG